MNSNPYFEPTGATVLVAGATTAPTGELTAHGAFNNEGGYMLTNVSSSIPAFVAFGSSGAAAAAAAVFPIAGTGKAGVIVAPLQSIFIRAAANQYVSAITASSTAAVYVTTGRFS